MNKLWLGLLMVLFLGIHHLLAQDSHTLKLLPIQAQEVDKQAPDSFKMKIKTKRYAKELTYVKAMITHDSWTAKEAKLRQTQQYYLTKIVFKEDKQSVLEIKSTPYLSKNVFLKFKYQSDGGKELSMSGYNNLGKSATRSVVIKDNSHAKKLSTLTRDVRNKVITSLNDKAIYDYFGDVDLIQSDEIQLTGPAIASNGGSVPIGVRSTIKAKRVTLFASEEDEKPKMVVQWILHRQTLVDFSIRIKLVNYTNYDGNIISAVIESEDGALYVTHIKIELAIAGGEV